MIIFNKLSIECENVLNEFEELPESMRLFLRFVDAVKNGNGNDDILDTMKVTLRVNNLSECKLSFVVKQLIKKANGQCLNVTRERVTYSMMNGYDQVLIMDIDGYSLSNQVLKMWNTMSNVLDSMVYDIAFHIGGHCQMDLPEQILLCTQINKLGVVDLNCL